METDKLVLELLRQLQDREIDEIKIVRDESSPVKAEIWINGNQYIDRRIIDSKALLNEDTSEWSKEKVKEMQEKKWEKEDVKLS